MEELPNFVDIRTKELGRDRQGQAIFMEDWANHILHSFRRLETHDIACLGDGIILLLIGVVESSREAHLHLRVAREEPLIELIVGLVGRRVLNGKEADEALDAVHCQIPASQLISR